MKINLFILILAALWFPIIQENFGFIKFKVLDGVIIPPAKPQFNKHTWFDGSYQHDYEKLYDSEYGCRSFLIRLSNQINFSLFRFTNSIVVIGKNDYLFEQGYLDEITGIDCAGKNKMKTRLNDLQEVQQFLANENILLVTLLAPGKSYYYKEYIPDYYQKRISNGNDYDTLLSLVKNYNINLIDANGWFLKMKDTARYPLFPKQGIHWNYYGMAIVADSVLKYIETNTKKDLAHFQYTLDFPDPLMGTDDDMGDLLNLLHKQKNPLMPYPRFTIEPPIQNKLRMLAVGDSFYWTILNSNIYNNSFNNKIYYYYNHIVYNEGSPQIEQPADYNILREVKNYDVIFLIQSTRHYQNIGTGFIQLVQKNIKKRNELRSKYIDQIKNDYPNLLSDYTLLHNVSTDSGTVCIADSLAMSELDKLSTLKINMRHNSEWMAQLEEKAKQRNVSVDDVMESDAEWMMSQENNNQH
jgi:hypothetical protein